MTLSQVIGSVAVYSGATVAAALGGVVSQRTAAAMVGVGCACLAAHLAFRWIMSSRYVQGSAAAHRPLRAAEAVDANTWKSWDGTLLSHESIGRGPENVLVIHGGPGNPYPAPWPALEALGDRFTFHFFHQRGSGDSEKRVDTLPGTNFPQRAAALEAAYGLKATLLDIHAIKLTLNGVDKPLHVIGHSFGGFIATLYAGEFPHAVATLQLVAPATLLVVPNGDDSLFHRIGEVFKKHGDATRAAEFKRFMNTFMKLDLTKTEAAMAETNNQLTPFYTAAADLHHPATAACRAECAQQQRFSFPGWSVWGLYLSMGMYHDYRAYVARRVATVHRDGKARMRVQVLHGAGDIQTHAATKEYYDLLRPAALDVSMVVMERSAHCPMYEEPTAYVRALGALLAAR